MTDFTLWSGLDRKVLKEKAKITGPGAAMSTHKDKAAEAGGDLGSISQASYMPRPCPLPLPLPETPLLL